MTQDLTLSVQDGGLGATTLSADDISAVVGCSSTGPTDRLLITSDIPTLVSIYGDGPAVEDAAYKISVTGAPVIFCKTPNSVAGVTSALTKTGTGSGLAGTTLTGAPFDVFDIAIIVTVAGTRGTAGIKLKYSLDGQRTFSQEVALGTATTYVMPRTGITINFGAGTYVVGDTITATTTAPNWVVGDLTAAMALLEASPQEFGLLRLVGPATGADATAVEGLLDVAETSYMRYVRAILETRDVNHPATEDLPTWSASVAADYAGVAGLRIGAGAGACLVPSPISQRLYRRSIATAAHARACQLPAQRDLGRVRSGALSNVQFGKPTDLGLMRGFWDERFMQGLDVARFMTGTTRIGKVGVFIKNPNMLTQPGSDFALLQRGRVMDIAMQVVRDFLGDEIGEDVPVSPATGLIDATEARALESGANARLRDALTAKKKTVSAICTLSRTDNLLSTQTLTASITLTPRAVVKKITAVLRYTNPALQALGT